VDVDAYLQRIKHTGDVRPTEATLRSLHRAHLYTVPFENLDIHLGRKIICDESRFLHKIVNERRGGFCYELNGAFAALLRALGFQVTLLSARVARPDGSRGPEFDHLTLRVDLEDPWLADVGFGEGFLDPLRLESRAEQPQNGRVYRLTSNPESESPQPGDGALSLEVMAEGKWKTEYTFTLQPHELFDFEEMCRYHQTSPESHFTSQRMCSLATPEGRITLSDEKLIVTRAGSRQETSLSGDPLLREEEWRAKLTELFGVVLPKPEPELGPTVSSKKAAIS
jgi:N-hydroxyarylamine O-acetyltransferase